jgi:two-component system phosphate regulon sensor histidine kinase PhoR
VDLTHAVTLVSGFAIGGSLWAWLYLRLRSEIHAKLPPGEGPLAVRVGMALSEANDSVAEVQALLRERDQLLRALPIGFLCLDRDNTLLECNPHAAEWLSIRSTALGRRRMLIECLRSLELDQLVGEAREGGEVRRAISRLPVGNREIAVEGTAVPLAAGRVGLFLVDRSDIERLVQQRDRWVGDVAHELKTPLTSIRLMAEMVHPRIAPAQQQWLERILREVQRLDLLVRDLLELSQWEAGAQQIWPQPDLDLIDLLYQTWQTLEPLAERRGVRLEIHGPDHLPVYADRERLYRALLNLLENAVRYNPDGKSFEVHLTAEGEWVVIDIVDHGPGFPQQDLERVFERFFRADPARARQTGGTGLGLAIVREIVEAHGGTIAANNHPRTGGAWLRLRLPVCLERIPDPQPAIRAE